MKAILMSIALMTCVAPTSLERRADCATLERSKPLYKVFLAASNTTGIPVNILLGLAAVESNMKSKANSGRGDYGLTQVRCRAWKGYFKGKDFRFNRCKDLYTPEVGVFVGAEILKIEYGRISSKRNRDLKALTSFKAGLTWQRRGIPPQYRYHRLIQNIGQWLFSELEFQKQDVETIYLKSPVWLTEVGSTNVQ